MGWGAAIGGIVGGLGSYFGAKESNKASSDGGKVDVWSERNPWAPSVPYRTDALGQMWSLFEENKRPKVPQHLLQGGGYRPQGPSDRTSGLADFFGDRATGGHALYGPSNDYVAGTLGGMDQNPYRMMAAGGLQQHAQGNPWLDAMMGQLFAGQMPGSSSPASFEGGGSLPPWVTGGGLMSGGMPGGGGGGFSASSSSGGPAPVGAAGYIKDILNEKYLGEGGNPYLDQLVTDANADISRAFNEQMIPGINTEFAGAGRYGSGAWQRAMGNAAGRYTEELAQSTNQLRYQDYNDRMGDLMNALGLGTQMDIAAGDRNASLQGALASAGARNYAADRSAMASMYGSELDLLGLRDQLESGERLGRLGALGDAIGSDIAMDEFSLSGLSDLAGMFSGDQQFALGMTPDLTGQDIRDLEGAFGASSWIDQFNAGERGRAASAGNQARNRAWDAFMFEQNQPWRNMAAVTDIINALSAGGGTTHDWGRDQRNSSPNYQNPWGQAISGAIAGYQLGDQIQGDRG